MHKDAAGMPTDAPTMIRDAVTAIRGHERTTSFSALTDITPNRRPVDGIVVPNDRIDELVEAGDCCPYHV